MKTYRIEIENGVTITIKSALDSCAKVVKYIKQNSFKHFEVLKVQEI